MAESKNIVLLKRLKKNILFYLPDALYRRLYRWRGFLKQRLKIWANPLHWLRHRHWQMELNQADSSGLLTFIQSHFPSPLCSEELSALLAVISEHKIKRVCEITIFGGETGFFLAHNRSDIKNVILIGPQLKRGHMLQSLMPASCNMTLVEGRSDWAATYNQIKNVLKGASIDLLFINGDRSYDGLLKDFLCYQEILNDGALILFYGILETSKTHPYLGAVPRFYKELKLKYHYWEFTSSIDKGGEGIAYVVYRKVGRK